MVDSRGIHTVPQSTGSLPTAKGRRYLMVHVLEASLNRSSRGDSAGHDRPPAPCAARTDSEHPSFLRRFHPNRRGGPSGPGRDLRAKGMEEGTARRPGAPEGVPPFCLTSARSRSASSWETRNTQNRAQQPSGARVLHAGRSAGGLRAGSLPSRQTRRSPCRLSFPVGGCGGRARRRPPSSGLQRSDPRGSL